ncbi:hypothetical protein Aple_075670 [Acrocarpospora pleiomorpha]|uniref:Uncharacterized protein n=1 Tax=Acrocarpospora pleiomorpha TaxID=90975 RepID=A0A5M3Y1S4_9ACTN|nr:hypothetical protein Aple_075670 [Acrocarpospora pleiomorpha]
MWDSAESVSSAYVQVGNSLWIGDRNWDRAQRSRLSEGLIVNGAPIVALPHFGDLVRRRSAFVIMSDVCQ